MNVEENTSQTVKQNCVARDLLNLVDPADLARQDNDPALVHHIRVAIKRTRAWLGFCRDVTGKTESYQQLVAKLRALSAVLSKQRDQAVALDTLAKLVEKYPGKKAERVVSLLREAIVSQLSISHADRSPPNELVDQIQHELQPFMQLEIPVETQHKRIDRNYSKMCRAGSHALLTERCDDIHVWRKVVKTLGYQMAITGVNKRDSKKQLTCITRLGDKLGKLHDLCFLLVMLEGVHLTLPHDLTMVPLYNRIKKERNCLLKAAGKLHRQCIM